MFWALVCWSAKHHPFRLFNELAERNGPDCRPNLVGRSQRAKAWMRKPSKIHPFSVFNEASPVTGIDAQFPGSWVSTARLEYLAIAHHRSAGTTYAAAPLIFSPVLA
jgi:hypothetical protein